MKEYRLIHKNATGYLTFQDPQCIIGLTKNSNWSIQLVERNEFGLVTQIEDVLPTDIKIELPNHLVKVHVSVNKHTHNLGEIRWDTISDYGREDIIEGIVMDSISWRYEVIEK